MLRKVVDVPSCVWFGGMMAVYRAMGGPRVPVESSRPSFAHDHTHPPVHAHMQLCAPGGPYETGGGAFLGITGISVRNASIVVRGVTVTGNAAGV